MISQSHPLITIGITCFNAEDSIEGAIQSALNQDWPNKEIVVVDDFSSDNSAALTERMASTHPEVRLVRHPINRGPGAARQTLLDECQGEYLAFFDDDDIALPERISAQYQRLTTYEAKTGISLAACYASRRRVYPNGYTLHLKAIGTTEPVPNGPDVAAFILFFRKSENVSYGATPSCALMARKSTFITGGGFDPAFRRVEDLDFAVRLALKGGHFIGCPEELIIQHATEASYKAPQNNLEAELMLADKHKTYLQSLGRYDYTRRWTQIRYYHFAGQRSKMIVAMLSLFVRAPLKTAAHLLRSGPKRLLHERKMKRQQA